MGSEPKESEGYIPSAGRDQRPSDPSWPSDATDRARTAESSNQTGSSRSADGARSSHETKPAEPSKDELFKVLGNRRRRHVLHYLEWRDRPVRLDELAERIAAWENDTTEEAIGSDERKRVYTALQQFHLPKLEDAGLVRYDDRDGTIERTEAGERLDVYLDLVPEDDIPWSYYYVGQSALGLALTGLSAVGLPLIAVLPPSAWAVGFVCLILLSALVHAHRDRQLRLGATREPPDAIADSATRD